MRGVAVGKVEEVFLGFFVRNGVAVHSLARRRIQLHAVEAGQIESPGVLRRDRIDAHAEQRMRHRLVHLDDVFVNAGDIFQEAGIAHARQLRFFLVGGQAGKIVFRLLKQALQIALGLLGNRSVGEKLLQQVRAIRPPRLRFRFHRAGWD